MKRHWWVVRSASDDTIFVASTSLGVPPSPVLVAGYAGPWETQREAMRACMERWPNVMQSLYPETPVKLEAPAPAPELQEETAAKPRRRRGTRTRKRSRRSRKESVA